MKYKAVEFSKAAIAKTYLVMASYQGENKIAGYFSLSGSKSFVVKTKGNEISKNMKRRFNKFGTYDAVLKQYHIAAPLIGQLGKNYKYKELITGDELLTMAVDMLRHVQSVNDTLRMYKNDDIRMYNFNCITDTIVEVITTCNTYTLLTVHLL